MNYERQLLNRRAFLRAVAASAGTVLLTACGVSNQANKPGNKNGSTITAASQQTPERFNLQGPPTEVATQAQAANTTGGTSTISGTGGGQTASATQGSVPTLPVPKSFKESPELSKMVKAGKLPKVEDRLPNQPMVLKPAEKVGKYGNTWKTETTNPKGSGYETRTMDYEHLVRWRTIKGADDLRNFSYAIDDVIPNVAESFEIGKGGKEYTFKLREGMKWSDGKPFTADDIVFWYEDVVLNEELSPGGGPAWMLVNGKTGKVEKMDDHTVSFQFPIPNGLFLQNLLGPSGSAPTTYPRHYLKQFHKKYNPKVVQEAKKAQMDSWADLFGQMNNWKTNKDLPVLFGWHMTVPIGTNPQHWEASRNPYYWKVDSEGNQLPYMDKVNYKLVTKPQVMLLNALNGEIDVLAQYVNELQNRPLFYKNQKAGNYHIIDISDGRSNRNVIALNLTIGDKVKSKIFNDLNFRIGLSYAMNRQEIIDTVYQGQGEPFQVGLLHGTVFYNEKLGKQYTEHDVNKANEFLDKVLPKKNSKGVRLGPDGKPFFFQIEFASEFQPEWADVLELVQRQWTKVGIQMNPKAETRDLLYTRKAGNEPDATIWNDTTAIGIMLDPRWYFPYSGESNFATPWANWYTHGGLQGKIPKNPDYPVEKPPAPAIKQMQLFAQVSQTADQKEQVKLMKQILDIAQQQFWVMGVTLPARGYGIVRNSVHNVPKWMLWDWVYLTPAPFNTAEWYKGLR